MKALFYKQLHLVAHPMTFLFLFFGVMLLIPNYPYTVAFFYVTLGIFFMYMNAREHRDLDFSALLPVRKTDLVRSAFLFCCVVEILSILIALPFCVLSFRINPKGCNAAGIDANAAVIAFAFLVFSAFNAIFFPAFYRNAYKVGTAFIKGSSAVAVVVLMDVIFPNVPALSWLDGPVNLSQWILLGCCIVLYIVSSVFSLFRSCKIFEFVDF